MGFLASSGDGIGGGIIAVYLVVFVVVVIGMWKVFQKAGEEGWKAIIPIYNVWTLLKIVGRPGWWIILFFIPIVNLIMWIIVANDVSKSFGKGIGFTVGLILLSPIFICILGFGDAQYLGPQGTPAMGSMAGGTPPPPPPPGATPPPPPPPSA